MLHFTKEHLKMMEQEAEKAVAKIGEGTTAREVMAQIYVDGMEYKTRKMGLLMADEALETLADFNQEYARARENIGDCMDDFCEKITEEKSVAECCSIWLELYTAVTALNNQLSAEHGARSFDIERLMQEVEYRTFSEEEVTEELEQELRAKALSALSNSGIMLHALLRQADALEMLEEQGVGKIVIQMGANEMEYEGILTMIAYVKIKNGKWKEMPADMTIDQVALAVAAAVEQSKIMEQVGLGKMAVDVAEALLKILGVVVILKLALTVSVVGIKLASSLFGLVLFLPTMLMLAVVVGAAVYKSSKGWFKTSEKIVKGTVKIIGIAAAAVVKGLRAVAEFVKEHVIPSIVSGYKKAVDDIHTVIARVRDLADGTISEEEEEIVTID
ncbi:MAG: hypothetical protein SO016_08510 [Lachnospiraceae bacterium]|nr:hypothetical protein [Robinsoniella sp.]MDY3766714.1 hypothetical protein [Lachnospiraceae bacterium]